MGGGEAFQVVQRTTTRPSSARCTTPPSRTPRTPSTRPSPPRPPGARCPSTTARRSSCAPPSSSPGRGARRSRPPPCSASRRRPSRRRSTARASSSTSGASTSTTPGRSWPSSPGQLAGRLEPPRPPPARGLRLRDHAVQLLGDRGQPAHRARADGQRRGLEAVPTQTHAAVLLMQLLEEAGLPKGVINLVTGDGIEVSKVALEHRDLAGIHFTGSTKTFQYLWKTVGNNIEKYAPTRVWSVRPAARTSGRAPSADRAVLKTALTAVPSSTGPEVLGDLPGLHPGVDLGLRLQGGVRGRGRPPRHG